MRNDEGRPKTAPDKRTTEATGPAGRSDDRARAELAHLAARRQELRRSALADHALVNRYATLEDFAAAVDRWFGGRAHRVAANGGVTCVACPACRSLTLDKGWLRFPIVCASRKGGTGTFTAFPTCSCGPSAIARELMSAERRRLDLELAELDEAA